MILAFASPLVTVRFLALGVAMQDLCAHRTKCARVSICPSFSLHTGHLFHHIPDHGMQAFEQVPWTPGNLSRWVCGTLRDVPAVQFFERKHETACHLWIASFADHGGFVNYSIFPDTRAFWHQEQFAFDISVGHCHADFLWGIAGWKIIFVRGTRHVLRTKM